MLKHRIPELKVGWGQQVNVAIGNLCEFRRRAKVRSEGQAESATPHTGHHFGAWLFYKSRANNI